MKQLKLFDIPIENKPKSKNKCKHCKHIQRWNCNTKVFFYCGKRKSNRTDNGLLKIKFNQESCNIFTNATTKNN